MEGFRADDRPPGVVLRCGRVHRAGRSQRGVELVPLVAAGAAPPLGGPTGSETLRETPLCAVSPSEAR